MLKSVAMWVAMTATALAADGEYSATTKSDAALRAAPSVQAVQLSVVPSQTLLEVTICFRAGAYCHVTGPDIDGYVAGDLLMISGEQSTVLDAETARWALMEENRESLLAPEWETGNIVFWGDSLAGKPLGDALSLLLPGREISMQGVPGESGQMIADRMLADTAYTKRFKVIWDRHYTKEPTEAYLEELAPIIEKARSHGDFIVISDIRQLLPSEKIPDPATDAAITAANNEQLAKLYPDNFLDVTAALEDLVTRAPDGLHLTDIGNDRVAQLLATAIKSKSPAVTAP